MGSGHWRGRVAALDAALNPPAKSISTGDSIPQVTQKVTQLGENEAIGKKCDSPKRPILKVVLWSRRSGLNRRPADYERLPGVVKSMISAIWMDGDGPKRDNMKRNPQPPRNRRFFAEARRGGV